ncbi:hypothetical protein ACHABX_08700 [Nesterenkonia halotolerans]|uniref:hypothetical protein n=1 Tax=Nesterenkonia halotolerans TaxID=225325 RepID=UPI003EE4DED7
MGTIFGPDMGVRCKSESDSQLLKRDDLGVDGMFFTFQPGSRGGQRRQQRLVISHRV